MMQYLLMIDTPEDRSKFETLYTEYRNLMYHVAFNVLHNQEDAEDAVHQAFLKVALIIEKVDGTICPRTKSFMAIITNRTALDMCSKRQRHPTVELNDNLGITVDYTGSNALSACMARLPARYRDVLMLKFHYGYTTQEIAKMLGLSEANVLKISKRARDKLEILCREEGIL